jgi:pimeloyl-ACP methyl ester carboxylesterase
MAWTGTVNFSLREGFSVAEPELQFLAVTGARGPRRIAYRNRPAASTGAPAVVWFGGFRSDMESTKARRIDAWCADNGHCMVRMDYAGHGASDGRFRDFVFSDWIEDAEAVLDAVIGGPAIVVGSSMGGWIATLIAKRRMERPESAAGGGSIAGLVLIAPACDFTQELMWPQFPEHVRTTILENGYFDLPSAYSSDPTPVTRELIEDGARNHVFGATFRVGCPVHILQGMRDPDVPWSHALRLVEHLPLDTVTVTLINDGDHRLSREEDIARLIGAVAGMAGA